MVSADETTALLLLCLNSTVVHACVHVHASLCSALIWQGFKSVLYVITETCPCNIQRFFFTCKNCKFHQKNFDIFLIFAQNIDCGYTLEPP